MNLTKPHSSLLSPFAALVDRWLEDRPLKREKGLHFGRPAMDILENEAAYQIKADLPGIDLKDMEIRMDGNALTLSGASKLEQEVERENYLRVERFRGEFERTFILPVSADHENTNAVFKRGVLTITIPKTKTEPRKVKPVNVK